MAVETAALIIKVDSSGADRATRSLDNLDKAAGGSERAANRLGKAWGTAIGLISSAAVIGATREFVRQADAYSNMAARLRLATGSQEEFNTAQKATFEIAQRTGSELESVVDLYGRLSQSTGELELSQSELIQLTETITQGFQISGATAQEAAGGLRQLSQAMAGGTLRAEEFNSIIESAPRIVQALADHFGVSFGKVRQLVNEGKVSSQDFARALLASSETMQAEFGQMPTTVGRAMGEVRNALTQMIGKTNDASGATDGLATAISNLADELSKPETIQAAQDAASLIANIGTQAVSATSKLTAFIGKYREWLADRGFVPGDDLDQLKARRDRLAGMIEVSESRPTWLGSEGNIEKMKAELAELERRIEGWDFRGVTTSFGSTATDPKRPTGGGGGTSGTTAQTTATKELTEAEKAYQEVMDTNTMIDQLAQERRTELFYADQRAAEGVEAFIEQLQFEHSLMGLSNVEREKAIALRQAGTSATDEQRRAIEGLIEAQERQAEAQAQHQNAMSWAGSVSDHFTHALMGIADGSRKASDAFADMAKGIVRDLAAMTIKMMAFRAIAGAMGVPMSAIGAVGGIFGGGRAGGGEVMSGSGYWVGEQGREWFQPAQGGRVIPERDVPGKATAANVKLEVINNGQPAQAQVTQQQMPDGTQVIKLVLDAVGESIANGTGTPYAAMKGRFGLRDAV